MADPGIAARVAADLPEAWSPSALDAELDNLAGHGLAVPGYFNKLLDFILDVRQAITAAKKHFDEHNVAAEHPKVGGHLGLSFSLRGDAEIGLKAAALVMGDDSVVGPLNLTANIRIQGIGGLAAGEPVPSTWYDVYVISSESSEHRPGLIIEQHPLVLELPPDYTTSRWVGCFKTATDLPSNAKIVPFSYSVASGLYLMAGDTLSGASATLSLTHTTPGSWATVDFAGYVPFVASAVLVGVERTDWIWSIYQRPRRVSGWNADDQYSAVVGANEGDIRHPKRRPIFLDGDLLADLWWQATDFTLIVRGMYYQV